MKVITLWEPWASLIAVGAKMIETRSWNTNYRGRIAIHAAKKIVKLHPVVDILMAANDLSHNLQHGKIVPM